MSYRFPEHWFRDLNATCNRFRRFQQRSVCHCPNVISVLHVEKFVEFSRGYALWEFEDGNVQSNMLAVLRKKCPRHWRNGVCCISFRIGHQPLLCIALWHGHVPMCKALERIRRHLERHAFSIRIHTNSEFQPLSKYGVILKNISFPTKEETR